MLVLTFSSFNHGLIVALVSELNFIIIVIIIIIVVLKLVSLRGAKKFSRARPQNRIFRVDTAASKS